ncbi:helix-turn-helix domain-containing protein [Thermomicrobium sp. 4228-Ro]|uniref:winged helix-turn-helix transcriptional regulator n=1 Tax=Thermomicrobium sp. 4228-Ro TaxID=2993937 RepID=UPI002248AE54|nr:helix-turn-helix domain-containing protein [Thermomicrobium sp. 4228-Ro]MCX2727686.1 helix-turn-helix domain-containing protein [Thermomicrobium sp. 4228-Ro]
MQTTPLPPEQCPLAQTAAILCDRWTPLILRDLARGLSRFSELERSVRGISPKTLSSRLKHLEATGLIRRIEENGGRTRYELTTRGRALLPLVRAMRDYGRTWLSTRSSG